MPSKSLLRLLSLVVLIPSLACAGEVVGYYEAQPDFGGARNRFCVEKEPNGEFNVAIATAYCPSTDCMNARIDALQFRAKLENNQIVYSGNCTLKIIFSKDGARILKTRGGCGDNHPYLYAEGKYRRVSESEGPDWSNCWRD